MKVYISGPITGTNDYMKRFEDAENYLIDLGYEVVNPAQVNAQLPKSTTWEEYMEMSMCMLKMCDAIYLMQGWNNSRGANIEMKYAVDNNLEVMLQE